MSGLIALWVGVACMAMLAVASEIIRRKMTDLDKRIQDGLAEYRKEVRAFEEKYAEDGE